MGKNIYRDDFAYNKNVTTIDSTLYGIKPNNMVNAKHNITGGQLSLNNIEVDIFGNTVTNSTTTNFRIWLDNRNLHGPVPANVAVYVP